MAKKSKKVEKQTRQLMESISELVKKKGEGYKFKSKSKKIVKKVKRTCPHWIMRKGKEHATVQADDQHPGYWKCRICGESFPVAPLAPEEYQNTCEHMVALVNQMQFYSVQMGGDAEDTKMFLILRQYLPRFSKATRQIIKQMDKRRKYEDQKQKIGVNEQFSSYAGFNYR